MSSDSGATPPPAVAAATPSCALGLELGRLAAMAGMITLPVLILDQLSKIYVSSHFRMFEIYPLIPGWLDCTYTLNPGAAFSLFANMPPLFARLSSSGYPLPPSSS